MKPPDGGLDRTKCEAWRPFRNSLSASSSSSRPIIRGFGGVMSITDRHRLKSL